MTDAEPAARPKISVIIYTRNCASRLPQFFAYLRSLDFPDDAWELVIVDHVSSGRRR